MLNEYLKFENENQVWRLIISDNDELLIETRNSDTKQAYFNCLSLNDAKTLFTDFQLDEKFWVGIEAVKNHIVFFHRYTKPDMPAHNQIIAFDIKSQKVLWQNEMFSFLAVDDENLYCVRNSMMGLFGYAVNPATGEIKEEIGADDQKIEMLRDKYLASQDYSNYRYTEKFYAGNNEALDNIILPRIENKELTGSLDYLKEKENLYFNFHRKLDEENIENIFYAFSLIDNKEILNITLNKKLNAYAPDSFFIYKNFLILLKDKTKVFIYKTE